MLDDFGKRLKEERNNLGLTAGQLAEKIGVSANTIRAYERIKNEQDTPKPPIDKLIQLSEIFDVSLDYLCSGKKTIPGEWDNRTALQTLLKTMDFFNIGIDSIDIVNPVDDYHRYTVFMSHASEDLSSPFVRFLDTYRKLPQEQLKPEIYDLLINSLIDNFAEGNLFKEDQRFPDLDEIPF